MLTEAATWNTGAKYTVKLQTGNIAHTTKYHWLRKIYELNIKAREKNSSLHTMTFTKYSRYFSNKVVNRMTIDIKQIQIFIIWQTLINIHAQQCKTTCDPCMLLPLLTIEIWPSLACLIRGLTSISKYAAWSPYSDLQ